MTGKDLTTAVFWFSWSLTMVPPTSPPPNPSPNAHTHNLHVNPKHSALWCSSVLQNDAALNSYQVCLSVSSALCHVAKLSYVLSFIMSSSALKKTLTAFLCIGARAEMSFLPLLINSPGPQKFSICNSNRAERKGRQRAKGRAVGRCLPSISTSYVGEREAGGVQSLHFMLIMMLLHCEQLDCFACIFQISLRFLWICWMKGGTKQSG